LNDNVVDVLYNQVCNKLELEPIQILDLIGVRSGWTSSRPDWRV